MEELDFIDDLEVCRILLSKAATSGVENPTYTESVFVLSQRNAIIEHVWADMDLIHPVL